jgi:integrase
MRKVYTHSVDVVSIRLDSGEQLSYLVNKRTGELLPLTFAYALERRLDSQSSTVKNIMHSLANLYELAFKTGFNLDAYLSGEEEYDADAFEAFVQGLFVFLMSGERSQKVAGAIQSKIQVGTFNNYWKNISGYIFFWLNRTFRRLKAEYGEEQARSLSHKMSSLQDRLGQYTPRTSSAQTLRLLNRHELTKLFELFMPDSSVFREDAVRWRNWAIFLTLLDSGMRKGELLNLRMADLPQAGAAGIKIVRRPDASDDPRMNRPSVKSAGRIVVLNRRTIAAIQQYITTYRPDFAGLPFIFLNDDCTAPLSINALNEIFNKVSRVSGIKGSAHVFRHTRHYYRLRKLDEEFGHEKAMELVRQEGGWSAKAGIPYTYKRQYLIDMQNATAPLFLDAIMGELNG